MIENFKAFNKAEIEIKPITILVGPNSGGKTSILNAIKLMKQTLIDENSNILKLHGINDFGKFEDVLNQSSNQKHIGFKFDFEDGSYFGMSIAKTNEGDLFVKDFSCDNGKFEYKIEGVKKLLTPDSQKPIYIPENFKFNSPGNEDLFGDFYPIVSINNFFCIIENFTGKENRKTLFERFYKLYLESNLPKVSESYINDFFLDFSHLYSRISEGSEDLYKSIKSEFEKINCIGPLRSAPRRTYNAEHFDTIGFKGKNVIQIMDENSQIRSELNNVLRKLDLAYGSRVVEEKDDKESISLKLKVDLTRAEVNLVDVGCGTSQILPIIVQSLLADGNNLTVIEQPEVHLHPKVQAELGSFFVESIRKHRGKYLIETHSEYFVERIKTHIMKDPTLSENIKIYYVERNRKIGFSDIKEIKIGPTGEYSKLPDDFLTNVSLNEITKQMDIMFENAGRDGK
jgi:predicted ATPase